MKNRSIFFLALAVAAALLASCNRFYTNADFDKKTAKHKTVAVLPYQIVTTGRMPKGLTDSLKTALEDVESVLFQRNFQEKAYIVGTRGGRELRVVVQQADKTNALLAAEGISIRESWTYDPQRLADILGVDAVVRARAQKHRIMSDAASAGIFVGSIVVGVLTGWGGGYSGRTNECEVSASIIDAKTGETLFTGRDEVNVDWSRPANEAIEQINRRICRRFPYSERK